MSPTAASRLAEHLTHRKPADSGRLADVGDRLRFVWPPEFIELFGITDGGEGWVGESYLSIFSVDELRDRNEPEFWPDLVLFGSDGGGEGFALRRSSHPPDIVMANLVGPDPAIPQGDMATFLGRLELATLFDPLSSRDIGER
jgi:hypothetical protein